MPLARLLFPIALALLLRQALSAGIFGACLSSEDCDSDLSCVDASVLEDECTDSSSYCVCNSKDNEATSCADSDDACRDSETCFTVTAEIGISGAALPGEKFCLDKAQASAVQELKRCSDEEKCSGGRTCVPLEFEATGGVCLAKVGEDVCVAVQSLRGVEGHMLVRQKHAMARVLCDGSGSCATRGHMVEFRGKAMMMGSYCALVGCEEKVMLVNSPRYGRGARFESHTEGLLWTPFAARYGSRVEEHVLRTVIHAGL